LVTFNSIRQITAKFEEQILKSCLHALTTLTDLQIEFALQGTAPIFCSKFQSDRLKTWATELLLCSSETEENLRLQDQKTAVSFCSIPPRTMGHTKCPVAVYLSSSCTLQEPGAAIKVLLEFIIVSSPELQLLNAVRHVFVFIYKLQGSCCALLAGCIIRLDHKRHKYVMDILKPVAISQSTFSQFQFIWFEFIYK
jgi:hypothetical protein